MTYPIASHINQQSTLPELCQFKYGDQWERELDLIMGVKAAHGLTVIFDAAAGEVRFLPGTGHPLNIDMGWARVYRPGLES